MTAAGKFLRATTSLCPHCFTVLPATLAQQGDTVYLTRICPEHGPVAGVVWRGEPDFSLWKRPKKNASRMVRQTAVRRGCPFDCGLCSDHVQKSCSVVYELTSACNLRCPVCFADSGQSFLQAPAHLPDDCSLEEHKRNLRWIADQAGRAVLQFSGGEPTLSAHLLPLIRKASDLFPAVQLNTNGLLLAQDPEFAVKLAEAGLSWVFLQFDGTSDAVYAALRGKPLLEKKMRALHNCKQAGLAVVLVPTMVRGVNEHELGNLLRLAVAHAPLVRGVHIQPMTRSGRNTYDQETFTITLPEILRLLHEQTDGQILPEHAAPPGCEHEHCSFHCRYRIDENGNLHPLRADNCRCLTTETAEEGAGKAVSSVVRHWQKPPPVIEASGDMPQDAFSAFIAQSRSQTISVTCMAFQDAWSLDIERLRGCCIHVYAPPGRLVPFCAYNLTNSRGDTLYRAQSS